MGVIRLMGFIIGACGVGIMGALSGPNGNILGGIILVSISLLAFLYVEFKDKTNLKSTTLGKLLNILCWMILIYVYLAGFLFGLIIIGNYLERFF